MTTPPVKQTQEPNLSLCPHCYCMTKTLDGMCGKCKREKTVKQTQGWEKEIERVVDGIGSPYGEGATYNGKSDAGKEYCHLDDNSRDNLIDDIRSLLTSQRAEIAGEILKWSKEWLERNKDGLDVGTAVAYSTGLRQTLDAIAEKIEGGGEIK